FVDRDADQDMAVRVLVDAKTQYPAVCNAAETLLVDRAIAAEFLPKAARGLAERGARLRGTQEVVDLLAGEEGIPAQARDVPHRRDWRDLRGAAGRAGADQLAVHQERQLRRAEGRARDRQHQPRAV
ncbi:MAG: hypothetical protein U0K60_04810, partial [Parafannyhessea umbonata]|nr:hypothetical protein [Parafannyhessea umbonata]